MTDGVGGVNSGQWLHLVAVHAETSLSLSFWLLLCHIIKREQAASWPTTSKRLVVASFRLSAGWNSPRGGHSGQGGGRKEEEEED